MRSCPQRNLISSAAAERYPLGDTASCRAAPVFLRVHVRTKFPWSGFVSLAAIDLPGYESSGRVDPSTPGPLAADIPLLGWAVTESSAMSVARSSRIRPVRLPCRGRSARLYANSPSGRYQEWSSPSGRHARSPFTWRLVRVHLGVSSNVRCCWRWLRNAPRHSLRSCPRRDLI